MKVAISLAACLLSVSSVLANEALIQKAKNRRTCGNPG